MSEKTNGLMMKYRVTKANGSAVDPKGKYFVLKLNSKNKAHAHASQVAALVYAELIRDALPALAVDLRLWVNLARNPIPAGPEPR